MRPAYCALRSLRSDDHDQVLLVRPSRHRPLFLLAGLPEAGAPWYDGILDAHQIDAIRPAQVWHGHKFVCGTGGRAGPIKIPELSAEEIEDLKARADNSMWLERGGFSSVKADLERFSGRSFEASSVLYVLKHLPGPTWSTAELPLKPLLVAAVRSSRLAVCRMNLPPTVSPPVPFFFLAAQQCQVYVARPRDSYKFTDNFRYDVEGIAALTARLHRRYILWMFDGMGTGDQELADALQNVPLNVFMDPKELLKRRMSPSAR
ncbi:hypothetical protein OF846_001930 [Rhodotorula toruloides]|nr:hypothetical protein OF846_001930 [Rhodotorula toruloides]